MANFRSRSLLDCAHSIHACMNCAEYVESGCEPAHSNQQIHGKGQSIKASDCYFAALCHRCHAWLDSGMSPDPTGRYMGDREDKQAMWRAAFDRTLLTLWEKGMVKVA